MTQKVDSVRLDEAFSVGQMFHRSAGGLLQSQLTAGFQPQATSTLVFSGVFTELCVQTETAQNAYVRVLRMHKTSEN